MTVRELVAHLQTLPQDLPVVYRRMSDWQFLEAQEVGVEAGIWHGVGGYVEQMNPYRSERGEYAHIPKDRIRDVVAFPGN